MGGGGEITHTADANIAPYWQNNAPSHSLANETKSWPREFSPWLNESKLESRRRKPPDGNRVKSLWDTPTAQQTVVVSKHGADK